MQDPFLITPQPSCDEVSTNNVHKRGQAFRKNDGRAPHPPQAATTFRAGSAGRTQLRLATLAAGFGVISGCEASEARRRGQRARRRGRRARPADRECRPNMARLRPPTPEWIDSPTRTTEVFLLSFRAKAADHLDSDAVRSRRGERAPTSQPTIEAGCGAYISGGSERAEYVDSLAALRLADLRRERIGSAAHAAVRGQPRA